MGTGETGGTASPALRGRRFSAPRSLGRLRYFGASPAPPPQDAGGALPDPRSDNQTMCSDIVKSPQCCWPWLSSVSSVALALVRARLAVRAGLCLDRPAPAAVPLGAAGPHGDPALWDPTAAVLRCALRVPEFRPGPPRFQVLSPDPSRQCPEKAVGLGTGSSDL